MLVVLAGAAFPVYNESVGEVKDMEKRKKQRIHGGDFRRGMFLVHAASF